MNHLVADIGNCRTKLFVVGNNTGILYSTVYETPEDLQKLFSLFPQLKTGIYAASGAVDGEMLDLINSKLERFLHFTSQMPVPIKNCYQTPETLGSDRLATAVGVNAFFPNTNLIVFDFGTAITIDFIDESNSFLGGNISPGLSIRLKSLNLYTKSLPLLSAPEKVPEKGTSTQTAIEAGVVNGIIGETMYYINRYPDRKIIFTGGDAFYFATKIKCPIFVFSNPVVFGLNKILIHNG